MQWIVKISCRNEKKKEEKMKTSLKMAHTVNQVFLEFTSIINYVHFILLTTYFIVCSHVIFPV